MKRLFSLLILFLSIQMVYAQMRLVHPIEGGFYTGLSIPLGGYHSGTSKNGAKIGGDLRYNINNTPWDCGIFLEINSAQRDFESEYSQNNRTSIIGIIGDYNFRQGTNFNPYAGIGVGLAWNDVVGGSYIETNGWSIAFTPRVGIEIFRHFRLSCGAQFSRAGYNAFNVSFGVVIGGGLKHKK